MTRGHGDSACPQPSAPGMGQMAPSGAQMGTRGLLGVLSFAPRTGFALSSLGLWWGCFSACGRSRGLAQLLGALSSVLPLPDCR